MQEVVAPLRRRHAGKGNDPPWTTLEILHGNPDDLFILGTVPCGPADEPWNQIERIPLNEYLNWRPTDTFFVIARGHSMIGMGIRDGAAVLIDRTEPVRPGRIILARLYGYEYTLKRYEPPYLIGESYERIEIPIEPEMNLHIVGVAKGAYIPFYL